MKVQFKWNFDYPSQRMPILANNIVSTSQPLAAQAGLRMLLKGGNAVDAALATAITLTVVEPTMNGLGSDAFAIIYDGKKLWGLNSSGRSPAGWTLEHFLKYKTMPITGWDSVTIPGAVSAWGELSNRFGNLPFRELFEPAINYAKYGFLVTPITADVWKMSKSMYNKYPEFAHSFLIGKKAPKPGSLFKNPDQARSLEKISKTRGKAFYEGDLAEKIVEYAKKPEG